MVVTSPTTMRCRLCGELAVRGSENWVSCPNCRAVYCIGCLAERRTEHYGYGEDGSCTACVDCGVIALLPLP
jgi:phage FluMu protein Com